MEHGGSAGVVLNMNGGELDELAMSLWGPYVEDKVERALDMRPLWNGSMRLVDVMDYPEQYEELRKSDEFETKRRGHLIQPKEYVLPVVDFSSLAGIERGLAVLEGLKSRRSAFRGVAQKKDKEYIKLMKYTDAAKRMLDKY